MKCKTMRKVIFFENEDGITVKDRKPSGYMKIEAREEFARLFLYINGLEPQDGTTYDVYLVKYLYKENGVVLVGRFSKALNEIKWNLDCNNVNNSGIPIDEFDLCAIIANDKKHLNNDIVCSLVAYITNKKEWRSLLKGYIKRNISKEVEDSKRKNVLQKENIKENERENFVDIEHAQVSKTNIEPENSCERVPADTFQGKVQTELHDKVELDAMKSINSCDIDKISKDEIIIEDMKNNNIYDFAEICPCSGCIYSRQGLNLKGGNVVDSYENVRNNTEIFTDVGVLFERYFQRYNPFNGNKTEYEWWKAGSPIYLYNILHKCNIKAIEIINPVVIMLHYKYRHLLVGLYSQVDKNIKLFICGAPGIIGIDRNPYGDAAKWVKAEGLHGDSSKFGYWLLYYDINSKKVINVK